MSNDSGAHLEVQGQEYIIFSNSHEWKLKEYNGESDKGKPQYGLTKHYPTLESLLKGLAELNLRKSDYQSLEDIAENVKQIKAEIRSKAPNFSFSLEK